MPTACVHAVLQCEPPPSVRAVEIIIVVWVGGGRQPEIIIARRRVHCDVEVVGSNSSRYGIKSAANGAPVQKTHIVWEEYLYPLRFLLYSFQDLFRKLTLFGKNTYTPLRLLSYSFTNTKHEHEHEHETRCVCRGC